MMMRKKKLLFGIAVIAAIALLIHLCGEGCKHVKVLPNNTVYAIIDSINEPDNKPQTAEIYIDASASMKGYFISDSPVFSGQLANLVGMLDNKKVFFVDETQPRTGMMTNLISDLRSQPNKPVSNFDKLLADMSHKVDTGKVVFLVTDGIMSVGKTTPKALQELGYAVRDSLKNFNGAIALFKFESEFKSDKSYSYFDYITKKNRKGVYYYTMNDEPIEVSIQKRPYYVIAVGAKENIRALVNNKLGAKEEIYFGIHDHDGHTTNRQSEDIDCQLEDLYKPVVLNATLPQCLVSLGKDYFNQNTEVYLNGDELVPLSAYNNSIIDEAGDINIVISLDAQSGLALVTNPTTGYVEFTVKVRNQIPKAWENLNSDNDSNIANDIDEQKRTYGLLTMLKGIKEALDKDEYLLEIKFKFKK